MNNQILSNKGLNILHLNIRSLFCKNKFEMFKNQIQNSEIQIICLSVTWIKGRCNLLTSILRDIIYLG